MMPVIKRWMTSFIIYLFQCLPIKHNKIFLFSFYGTQFGCNPKYITNYINDYYESDFFNVVWAFNKPEEKEDVGPFLKVRTMSLRYFYHLCTAKVIVTNARTPNYFVKRKSQYYIQTWHSSLRLKQIEKDAVDTLPASYIAMAKQDSKKCDLLLSGCQRSTEIFKKSFWYDGEIFQYGTPRNDVLIQNNKRLKEMVYQKLNLPLNKKIILYAPTFRQNHRTDEPSLCYDTLIKTLTNKYGGEWVVLVRWHPHLIAQSELFTASEHVMNVTSYDDVQELLIVSHMLISDYSSLIFDYALTARPCYLYVPDIQTYLATERQLYFELDELPFIKATNHDELVSKINTFNEKEYALNVTTFLQKVGSYENGMASEHLLKRIEEVCFGKSRGERVEAV